MRIKTPAVGIRGITVGGGNPIVIQAMTDTDTADAKATARQCMELADAGAEMVRITVNDNFAAPAIPKIRKILDAQGYSHLPLIGDFHFNGHVLLAQFPETAAVLDKYRINPGNVREFDSIIKIAIANDKPVRIGANWGSLDQKLLTEMMDKNARAKSPKSDREVIIEAMVQSALSSARKAEKLGLTQNRIVLSVKMSEVQDTIRAYELLTARMKKNKHIYALHLGLTEAGSGLQGLISSSAALAVLLHQGIGDTIRISLTPTKDAPRTREVEACKTLLQAMGQRNFRPRVTSCPGCGRTDRKFFQKLAAEVNRQIETKLKHWQKKYPQIAELKVAVMGCVVNGPGESQHADIAISLPGKTEKPVAPVYIKGKFFKSITGKNIPREFGKLLEDFIKKEFR